MSRVIAPAPRCSGNCLRQPRLSRRQSLVVLSGAAMGLVAGCGSERRASGQVDASGQGGSGATMGGDASVGSGGAGAGSGGRGLEDASLDADAAPTCVDPGDASPGCRANPSGRRIGLPCEFAEQRIHPAPGADMFDSALVGRDDAGWYARAALCTHQGCNLADPTAMVPQGVACPCHGSLFDHHGVVFPGQPAKANLRAVALKLGCDGALYVDVDETVDPGVRLTLP